MTGQQQEKWQQVAELIQRLGLVSGGQDEPRTAAQVARMTTRQLLQDPVRAAIYNRGWADRTTDIQRRLRPHRPPSTSTPGSRTPSLTRPPPPATTPAPVTPAEPAPVPRQTGVLPGPTGRVRTEAQQARNRRKFQQLKEKRKARESEASQQRRLAKQPAPTSDPEAAGTPPANPTPMEVDKPASKDGKSEEPGQPTSQESPDQSEATVDITEADWLVAFEGMPELDDTHSFYTPVGSPKHPQ
ncbi:proteoglycan 4-like [Metopolophium dirhodum]|uniref:proteoglycan 4-like n=1 Tax=Metopolophium dirhodum TaxID=44670 RepID=UPI002990252B|nr:proteoglycan 4-like [Metopolophium dirhodum]